ncbi:AraC family transcriptional regulator [Rhizobium lusitanum]|uniref:AraC family transcriptional regulator n=1 Tax=Rhizobium lusitanum TaxID=293958 RepID=UPI001956BF13|nr:AraC family transcriptional regulator [Rhizobium lusitanum]MBM7048399.1 AraC family transcriptional regulator ligand-binding domain-containing protein [Rhizobium lusitanum]
MSEAATIRASVLLPILAQIENTGLSVDTLLARHGILRSQISDPYAMVSLARYVSLFEDAAKLSATPHLGALLGTKVTPGDLGPTGVLFSISPTILDAINRLKLYISAIQRATSSGLQVVEDNYVWSYQLSSSKLWPRRQDSEFTLSACCQLIRLGFSRSWRPIEIHFEHPEPLNPAPLEKIFRAPLKFGQPSNRLFITRADAQRTYRSEDSALVAVLEHHIAELAEKQGEPQSLRDRVRSLIGTNLGYGKITITTVADDLGLAPRTLQRRLQEDGTSLREMIEIYRSELAQKQLDAKLKKVQIADALGYADSTVFWRARRRWAKDG